MTRTPLWFAILPVAFLVTALAINVNLFGDSSLDGSNQLILLAAAGLTAGLAKLEGKAHKVWEGIQGTISDSSKAIFILLMVGALAGTWLVSGIIPTLIVYGLDLLSPSFFLPATVILCSIVSLATGSSWSTTATIGIALMGVGQGLGFSPGLVAGAVISGAYFGDKMSPFSDTTNLAPAMAGAELTTHIRHMAWTSGPAWLIALVAFFFIGLGGSGGEMSDLSAMSAEIQERFVISPWLLVVPLISISLIAFKTDAVVAMAIGALGGGLAALIAQPDILFEIAGMAGSEGSYRALMQSMYGSVKLPMTSPLLNDLMSSSGMSGMLGTIWLILCALAFGGALEASGFLGRITEAFLSLAESSFSLILTTLITCGFINVSASDQYLAIVVPGRMFKKAYQDRGLAPENLSRALEDSGTVTSVLIPWNTCGAYQSGVLGVATGDYFAYAIFNWLSPLINMLWAAIGFKIPMRKA
ncbi:MAG: sodium:proton antiporter [Schleiferiaceae bacterium]|nr:sodium:proton antiporter [Schleiferiaceae bacterium]